MPLCWGSPPWRNVLTPLSLILSIRTLDSAAMFAGSGLSFARAPYACVGVCRVPSSLGSAATSRNEVKVKIYVDGESTGLSVDNPELPGITGPIAGAHGNPLSPAQDDLFDFHTQLRAKLHNVGNVLNPLSADQRPQLAHV